MQKTVQLSELFQHAVTDDTEISPIKRYEIIANVLRKIEAASKSLRLQIISKMKRYLNKEVSQKEMVNTLTLTDYLVDNVQYFRKQVYDIDFICYIEILGQFKVCYRCIAFCRKVNTRIS